MSFYKQHIFLCTNQKPQGKVCCANSGGDVFFDYLKKTLHEAGIYGPGQIRVSKSGCLGRCKVGPCLVIYPEGIWYTYQSMSDIDEIVQNHFIKGRKVERLLLPLEIEA